MNLIKGFVKATPFGEVLANRYEKQYIGKRQPIFTILIS